MSTPTPPPEPGEPPQPAGPQYGQYGQPAGGQPAAPQPPTWGNAPQAPSYGQPQPPAATPGQPSGHYGQYGERQDAPLYMDSQPGIIPLRPLTIGEMYDGAFKAIRTNPAVMFGLSAAVVGLIALLQGVVMWQLFEQFNALAGQAADPNAALGDTFDDAFFESLSATIVPMVVAMVVGFVVTTILNGVLIHSVSQSVIGRKLSLRELWDLVRPQLLRLLLLTLVIGVGIMLAVSIVVAPAIAAALNGSIGAAAGLGILGTLLAVAVGLFLLIATVLATPVLVLERAGVIGAIRRSWQLTRRAFWRITGLYLLTSVLVSIVSQIVVTPFSFIGGMIGSPAALTVAPLVAATAVTAITTPFMASVIALIYVDVRIRTEALDVELAAAAAAQ